MSPNHRLHRHRDTVAGEPDRWGNEEEMKTIHYHHTLQWTGLMRCPACGKDTPCWRSSGMSQMCPHFYCDKCSNALHRQDDYLLIYNGATAALLEQIRSTLPHCPCGGQFTPEANPKCSHCGLEYPLDPDPMKRMNDPYMIVLHGSLQLVDDLPPERVLIDAEPTTDGKKIIPCDCCGKRFRVPTDKGDIEAKCPHCHKAISIVFRGQSYETTYEPQQTGGGD